MAQMKNICGKIPLDLHEKVRAEIELKESSTQLFIQQVIEEHFNRLEQTGQNGRRMKEPEEPMFTITATDRHGVVYRGRIQKLVPRECLRLQGYYDWQIDRMEKETSDSQFYKQAGNGVTINVIEAIGRLLCQVDHQIKTEDAMQ